MAHRFYLEFIMFFVVVATIGCYFWWKSASSETSKTLAIVAGVVSIVASLTFVAMNHLSSPVTAGKRKA